MKKTFDKIPQFAKTRLVLIFKEQLVNFTIYILLIHQIP